MSIKYSVYLKFKIEGKLVWVKTVSFPSERQANDFIKNDCKSSLGYIEIPNEHWVAMPSEQQIIDLKEAEELFEVS